MRRFKLDRKGWIFVNQNMWLDKLQLAAHNLQFVLDVRGTVVAPQSIMPATIKYYRRTYSKVNVEMFEAFGPGTVLTFDLLLRDDRPKCPSVEQMSSMLDFVGEWEGVSQFGSKFGFGRFTVLNLKSVNNQTTIVSPDGGQTPKSPEVSDGGERAAADYPRTELP